MNINSHLASMPGATRYGASMGRRDTVQPGAGRFYLQRMRMVDYAYDAGGAYWGAPSREHGAVYAAMTADGASMIFERATSRAAARAQILARYPSVSFYR